MVERLAVNEDVVGSIPTSGAANKNTPQGVFLLAFLVSRDRTEGPHFFPKPRRLSRKNG